MKQGKVHIDDLFRRREQPLVQLPSAVWDDIKRRLDEGPPNRRGFPYRWWWYIAFGFFIATIISFYHLRSHPEDKERLSAASVASQRAEVFKPDTPRPEASQPVLSKGPKAAEQSNHENVAGQQVLSKNIARDDSVWRRSPVKAGVRQLPAHRRYAVSTPGRPPLAADSAENASLPTIGVVSMAKVNITAKVKEALVAKEQWQAGRVPARPVQDEPLSPAAANAGGHPATRTDMHSVHAVELPAADPVMGKKSSVAVLVAGNYARQPEAAPDTPLSEKLQAEQSIAGVLKDSVAALVPDKAALLQKDTAQTIADKSASVTLTGQGPLKDSSATNKKNRLAKPVAFGFKAGYEAGPGQPSINKLLAGPYAQYYISKQVSVSLQLAVKYGMANGLPMPGSKSYYSLTGTAVDTQVVLINGRPFNQYTFRHTYDSITVGYHASATALEAEVPLILRYHLPGGLSFGGGVSVALGRLIAPEEQRQSVNLTQTAVFVIERAGTHAPPDTSASFYHTALPYSSYTPLGQSRQNPVRTGYLLCLGYDRKKWNLEVCMQQTISGTSGIYNQDIKKAYSLPYFRLLLGYRLGKN